LVPVRAHRKRRTMLVAAGLTIKVSYPARLKGATHSPEIEMASRVSFSAWFGGRYADGPPLHHPCAD
jgi:hypothetical protein